MLAAVSVAAVAGTWRAAHPSLPTKDESSWLVGWGIWNRDVYVDLEDAELASNETPSRLLRALQPLAGCDRFATRVPPAPSRYRLARAASIRICSTIESLLPLARRIARGDDEARVGFGLVSYRAFDQLTAAEEGLRVDLDFNQPLPTEAGPVVASHIDPRLSSIASALAGRPVEARCWTAADWPAVQQELNDFYDDHRFTELYGFAEPAISEGARIHLAPDICGPLERSASWRSMDQADFALDVEVLAHESGHVFGPSSTEAEVECHGMQTVPRTAALLGLPPSEGRVLANLFARVWYPHRPAEYRTPLCRENGPLDETPHDGVWP